MGKLAGARWSGKRVLMISVGTLNSTKQEGSTASSTCMMGVSSTAVGDMVAAGGAASKGAEGGVKCTGCGSEDCARLIAPRTKAITYNTTITHTI